MSQIIFPPSANPELKQLIIDSCDAFISMESDLNELDAKTGDGDTGSTVALAARSLKTAVDQLPLANETQFFRALGDRLSTSMGGSSGVLLAILFSAASDASGNGATGAGALRAGLEKMMEYAALKLVTGP